MFGTARLPEIDGATVASIQTIFQRSRLDHPVWLSRLLEGRLDSRHAWRNDARGSVDIFKDRKAMGTTKVNVWLLVDASGSMNGDKALRSMDTAATLAEAFKRISTVNLHVWQHKATSAGTASMHRVYERGVVAKFAEMPRWIGGGNADGFALQWIGERALKAARQGERTIIIVISDGLPSVHATNATNYDLVQFSHTVATRLRTKGAAVLSISIERDAESNSYGMYGRENVVPFDFGSHNPWVTLAQGLAEKFGRVLR